MTHERISKSSHPFSETVVRFAAFLGCGLLYLLTSNAYGVEANDLQNTIEAIQAADASGADTSELVNRLNSALNSESSSVTLCLTPEECANKRGNSFQSLANDANTLADQSNAASINQLIISQIVAIIVAFIGAFSATLFYQKRGLLKIKTYLAMALSPRAGK
jgi:hypothetical protein